MAIMKQALKIPPYLYDIVAEMDFRTVLDVLYLHIRTKNGDDMFFTEEGIPFVKHLLPSNFIKDKEWITANWTILDGSSLPYRVSTKPFDGTALEVIIKWNRMGINPWIPYSSYQFNTPFEEFALVRDFRDSLGKALGTQHPLAIYVPCDRATLEALQRRKYLMERIVESHRQAELDMHRQYAVIYRWIPGDSLLEKVTKGEIEQTKAERWVECIGREIRDAGFSIADLKMSHIILDVKKTKGLLDENENLKYHVVDFELLYRMSDRKKERGTLLSQTKERLSLSG